MTSMDSVPIWVPDQPSNHRLATCGQRALPRFLIIGAQRAGSTSLYDMVANHPRVLPAVMKEIHFFDAWFDRGECYYRAHFPLRRELHDGGRNRVSGEATPYLLFDENAPDRVRSVVPDVRLIAILRDPVARAYSHYHHQRRRDNEPLGTFEEAIDAELARRKQPQGEPDPASMADRDRSYLQRGHYAEQLERWIATFDREQMLVVFTARLSSTALPNELDRVWSHLDLPPALPTGPATRDARRYPPMSAQIRRDLNEYFAPRDEHLGDLLGRPPPWRGTSQT